MVESFYNPFDQECLVDDFNRARKADYRSVFHQDRDRLMFTPSFRRLQAKTQVFQAGEYDFYRTRLTHSLEVSRIADSIAVWLCTRHPEVEIDAKLLEAICLSHDIGHPPFGHAGERVLNDLMTPYGGFEGNAQTLRILTRTIYSGDKGRTGMSPSRALLDGILKYKRLHRDRGDESNHFIYDDQAGILEFCFGTADLAAKIDGDVNKFQSIECQIMDLADDIAYSCFDIIDGVRARFISSDKINAWVEKDTSLDDVQRRSAVTLVDMIVRDRLQPRMNQVIGELIQGASLKKAENFMTSRSHRHGWKLIRSPEAESRIKLHKKLAKELVYGSGALRQMEYKGAGILRQLVGALFDNYTSAKPIALVSDEVHRAVIGAKDKAVAMRALCDYVSGMTDAFALRTYRRLFDPNYGSISELM